jgi:hypothetical protein
MQPSDETMKRRADESFVLQTQVEQAQAAKSLRPCPYCAELIQPAAVVCRFCGRDVEATAIETPTSEAGARIEELERKYPLFVSEGWNAMGWLREPPSDRADWLEKFCEARRNGHDVKRASRDASASAQWW